jgi:hypothetical protein
LLATPAWRVEILAAESVARTPAPHPDGVQREDAERLIAHLGLMPIPG